MYRIPGIGHHADHNVPYVYMQIFRAGMYLQDRQEPEELIGGRGSIEYSVKASGGQYLRLWYLHGSLYHLQQLI